MSPKLTGLWIGALLCASLHAGSLTVTVRDPGQALVANAAVEVRGTDDAPPNQSTDTTGRATFRQLTPGTYRVAVTKDGFADWEGSVKVSDRPASLAVSLKLSGVTSSVHVTP